MGRKKGHFLEDNDGICIRNEGHIHSRAKQQVPSAKCQVHNATRFIATFFIIVCFKWGLCDNEVSIPHFSSLPIY